MKNLSVLYIADENFAPLVGISVTSLFENNPAERIALSVYILTTNMSDTNKSLFADLAEQYHQCISIINVGGELKKIEQLNLAKYRGSAMTNLRLWFDKFVPNSIGRILYVDADTIICDSIEELAEYDMQGKMLGMVYDAYGKIIADKEHKGDSYYNAGIILIDCEKWRRGLWRKKIISYINRNGAPFAHPDQDIYNILCRDEIVRLPIRYNYQPIHQMYSDKLVCRLLNKFDYYSPQEISEGRKKPAILHMVRVFGRNPWHKDNTHPFDSLYKRYKKISPWNNRVDDEMEIGWVIRIEIMLHKILPQWIFLPLSFHAIKMSMKRS